MIVCELATR